MNQAGEKRRDEGIWRKFSKLFAAQYKDPSSIHRAHENKTVIFL